MKGLTVMGLIEGKKNAKDQMSILKVQGYDKLKANPSRGAGASNVPMQFGRAVRLVLVWPFHSNLQSLKQLGVFALG
jgi:hypothetical protein